MTRRLLLVLLALAAAGAIYGLWRWRAGSKDPGPQLETMAVDRGRIVGKVTATGTLSALVTVQVGSQVSGRVQALHADFNTRVEKGQLIARIDPQLFEAAREQARANLVAAEGNLAKSKAQAIDARRQWERNRVLAGDKLIAQADLDTSESNRDAAAAQVRASEGSVAQAKAALHQAEVNLAYTRILSPTSGVVISRNVDVGQTVAASLQAPILFVIAEDLSKMQVDTSVAEGDVGRLRDGMKATFTVDAFPDKVFEGHVRQIRNAATTTSNVVTYDAVVDVSNPDLELRPGMTANVTFIYAEVDDAMRVPNAGLRFRPTPSQLAVWGGGAAGGEGRAQAGGAKRDGGAGTALAAEPGKGRAPAADEKAAPDRRTVYVSAPAAVRAVRIRTGITDGSYTQVMEGELSPGEQVVTDAPGGDGVRRMTGPRGPL